MNVGKYINSIFAGFKVFTICSTAKEGKYSCVLPGKPKTSVKSSSLIPSREIGKKCFGVYGILSLEYSAGLLTLLV